MCCAETNYLRCISLLLKPVSEGAFVVWVLSAAIIIDGLRFGIKKIIKLLKRVGNLYPNRERTVQKPTQRLVFNDVTVM